MSGSAFKAGGRDLLVWEKGEEEYERSVATPNLLYRFARPDCVLQPKTIEQVQSIVRIARDKKIKLTIKCGGHSYAGHSTAASGVSLDLRWLSKTKLDMSTKTITFGGGCQWGQVYKTLINGPHNGFVINGGRCPFVGVGGFLLGGGLGPFSRSIGMGSDTVKEIKIVTADSKLVTVKDTDRRDSKEGRLFWALRGAGGGNFGVVVEMKLAVAQLQSRDGSVVAGRYQWFAKKEEPDLFDQPGFMDLMNKFYTTDWPENITIDSTWICDLRQSSGNGVRFLTYFDGPKKGATGFDAIIDKYIAHPELAKQLKRRSLSEKSTRFLHETLVAQWSEETIKAFPTNKSYSIFSSFVFKNDRATIEKVTAIVRKKALEFRASFPGERVEFLATFIHSGGKMGAPRPDSSAFFWREAVYHMYLTVEWDDKWMELDMRGFLGKAKEDIRPYSLQGQAAFVNFPDGAFPSEYHERAYWGKNREELRQVKQIWDKDNFFNSPQGIKGGAKGPEKEEEGPVDQGNDEDLTDGLATDQWERWTVNETKDLSGDLQNLADLGLELDL
ncbi:FAD-binding domain-containing protein [Mycena indigotica]|uniref:FAD-binding domain-containing protein n=1 Tax=Mycena indigotica TaxID=2126181 RepID=A0A8H6SL35_9AGAR|nr:FAD-binding domain-containing protein [Mycena indigotica]KAF7301324.1 FAD-binding domain-containing protein [Mycena indigotica]